MPKQQEVLDTLEDAAGQIIRRSKHVLPHIARFFLVATFIEDGLRMWFYRNEQLTYMMSSWRSGWFLGSLYVAINCVGQIGACALILTRRYIPIACYTLLGILLIQTVMYSIFTELSYFVRILSLSGGVVLLIAECKAEGRSLLAGLPSSGATGSKQYMQLGGRVLLILLFIGLISNEWSALQVTFLAFTTPMMGLILIGYKTKLSSLVLSLVLFAINFYMNPFWLITNNQHLRDFVKYDFFQMISIVGGLLLLVVHGPGDFSIEERKKWS